MTVLTTLRPAQLEILNYRGGPLAISAVPGAGKTFILTQLIAHLVGDPDLSVRPHQILVLTYMRGAALTFKRRSAAVLTERGLTAYGLQCMTIHAFCLAVVRHARGEGAEGDDSDINVLQEIDQVRIMRRALDEYLEQPGAAEHFARNWGGNEGEPSGNHDDPIQLCVNAAVGITSTARNFGLSPSQVDTALASQPELAFLFRRYEEQRNLENALDYDTLVTEAIRVLETDESLRRHYQKRFRYVFEDEAQDSTPAQDRLIKLLTSPELGGSGNLVRVGDSNQAIMTSFTFNDPRFFRAFCNEMTSKGGRHIPMQESSRSAECILNVANALAASARLHPAKDVREAFVGGPIETATAGKRNPEPDDQPSWTVYKTKDDEQLNVLLAARRYLQDHPERRAAILVYSNNAVSQFQAKAQELGLPVYATGRRMGDTKPVLRLLARVLTFLSLQTPDPNDPFMKMLGALHEARGTTWVKKSEVYQFLKSMVSLETLIYPPNKLPPSIPAGLDTRDYATILFGAKAMRALLDARHLPAAELLPAIAAELLTDPDAPMVAARAAKIAAKELHRGEDPLLSLRALVIDLAQQTSDRREILAKPVEINEPAPGQLEILTLHRSKGAEFDAVWLPGLGFYYGSNTHFPWQLEQVAIRDRKLFEAEHQLQTFERESSVSLEDRTRQIQCLTASERLRLLYVGVTRAMRSLHLSCVNSKGNDPALPHIEAMIAHCERRKA